VWAISKYVSIYIYPGQQKQPKTKKEIEQTFSTNTILVFDVKKIPPAQAIIYTT